MCRSKLESALWELIVFDGIEFPVCENFDAGAAPFECSNCANDTGHSKVMD